MTLRRVLTTRDLVLFNMVAVIGLRWLATSAKAGPAALVLWVLAVLFFFVPQGLVVSDLARRYPREGGIYAWTRDALGDGHGFLCGWCYWICNVMYYPMLLMSMAVIATYAFGAGDTPLGSQWTYVLLVTLGALWLAVAVNVVGLARGRWLQNVGGVATFVPGVTIVALGIVAVASGTPPANTMDARAFVPDITDLGSLNLWASIAFAFAGLELSSAMGAEVEDAPRAFPRSILISAPLIAGVYLLGTGALLWLVPSGELNIVSGLLQGIAAGVNGVTPALAWLVPFAAACYAVGNLGGVGAWLTGPARVAFAIGLDRYFPPAFARVHPRWGTPHVAILTQASLATLFLLLSVLGRGTRVETVYLILLDTQLLIYFVPFVYLFVTAIVLARREGRSSARATVVAGSGMAVTLFAMLVATIPPSGTEQPALFVLKVVGGAAAFIGIGAVLFVRAAAPQPAR